MADKLRVISIDDEAAFRQSFVTMMKVLGYEADHTERIDELMRMIDVAQQDGKPYDLATIDMDFKIGDEGSIFKQGELILKQIKSVYPQLRCIMISGKVLPNEVLTLRDDFGMDYFIPKDRLDMTAFQAAVKRVMSWQPFTALNSTENIVFTPTRAKSKIFVSYKRQNTWGKARAITNSLRQRGVDVFLDVDSIDEGRFERYILQAIADCQYFLVLLSPGTLDSVWVIKEIEFGLKMGKIIIPVLLDDFKFDADLPDSIAQLSEFNAVTIRHDFYDAAIDLLIARFLNS